MHRIKPYLRIETWVTRYCGGAGSYRVGGLRRFSGGASGSAAGVGFVDDVTAQAADAEVASGSVAQAGAGSEDGIVPEAGGAVEADGMASPAMRESAGVGAWASIGADSAVSGLAARAALISSAEKRMWTSAGAGAIAASSLIWARSLSESAGSL